VTLGIKARTRELGIVPRVESALAAAPYDAVIGLSVEASQYLSGYWFPYARNRLLRQNIVVWPRHGEPVLLCGLDQLPGPTRYSWIRDIRPYAERGRRPPGVIVELLIDTLCDLGLESATLGIETLCTPIAFFDVLHERLPAAHWQSCDAFFDELRMVKTTQETSLITACAAAAEQGMMAALRQAHSGWTEKQLANLIRQEILARGVDDVTTILLGAGDGARGYLTPTDDVMPDGALVRIDLNAIQGGYYADMGRMAVMGRPSPAQEEAYDRQLRLNHAVIDGVRPGVTAASVFTRCRDQAEALDVELLDQPFIGLGHATGINNSDFPKLNELDETLLEPGMVLNIEPDTFGPDREIMHVEEMLLLGSDAASVITATEDWSTLPRLAR
jgi:Xaa-Pro dipeptidase